MPCGGLDEEVDSMRTAGKLASSLWIVAAVVVVAVSMTAALSGSARISMPTGYPHQELQSDLRMTEQMSVPDTSGPMFDGTVVDDQLRRSEDPAYVAALEAHQQEIDRMLGRLTP